MMAVGHFRSVCAEDLDITMNDSLALQISTSSARCRRSTSAVGCA